MRSINLDLSVANNELWHKRMVHSKCFGMVLSKRMHLNPKQMFWDGV